MSACEFDYLHGMSAEPVIQFLGGGCAVRDPSDRPSTVPSRIALEKYFPSPTPLALLLTF